ncbi:MAG: DUF3427 domain-containing protein [Desulfobacteraceae bacterium]|nr:DUF3427 domain-containing protein [Desulfobacteraceae bacterium]
MSSRPGPGIYDTLLDRVESQGSAGTGAVRPGSGPTTMYADYPISRSLLHWESQSNTALDSPTGQNLVHHTARGYTILVFSRDRKKNNSCTMHLENYFSFSKFFSDT